MQNLRGDGRCCDEHRRGPEQAAAPARLAVLERIVERAPRAPWQYLEIRERGPEWDVDADSPVHRPSICLQHRPERPLSQLEPSQQHRGTRDGEHCPEDGKRFRVPGLQVHEAETKPPNSVPTAPMPTPSAATMATPLDRKSVG